MFESISDAQSASHSQVHGVHHHGDKHHKSDHGAHGRDHQIPQPHYNSSLAEIAEKIIREQKQNIDLQKEVKNSYARALANEHKHLPPLEIVHNDGTRITESGNSVSIVRSDGKRTAIKFNRPEHLTEIDLANGEVWKRDGKGHHWTSSSGMTFEGQIKLSNTSVSFAADNGMMRIVTTDGAERVLQHVTNACEFAGVTQRLFSQIDRNGDGSLSKEEIDRAMQTGSYQGQDAQVITVMEHEYDRLQNLSGEHGGLFGPGGITLSDLSSYEDHVQSGRNSFNMSNAINKWAPYLVNYLDADGDGTISRDELKQPILDPKVLNNPAAKCELGWVVDYLKSNNRDFDMSDLKELAQRLTQGRDQDLARSEGYLHQTSEAGSDCKDLFANKANPLLSIRPEAVNQGAEGDCYFLAALSSLAKQNPQAIANMIKDNGNGTCTVTFPESPAEHITVSIPTSQELGLYARGHAYGVWPAVLEKAYGEYNKRSIWRGAGAGSMPQDGADGGSASSAGVRVLTGKHNERPDLSSLTVNQLDHLLTGKLNAHQVVTCITGCGKPGLPATHEYSVLAYNPGTQTVVVRNPWGGYDRSVLGGTSEGIFTMKIDDFKNNFAGISYPK